jgi:integrase/recombinase XerC
MMTNTQKIQDFLSSLNRADRTIDTYRYALTRFVDIVGPAADLDIAGYVKFLKSIKTLSPSTQKVWKTAVMKFYLFCGTKIQEELRQASDHYARKVPATSIINFDIESIETLLDFCEKLSGDLAALRDRAFVFTLADSGLRISEACALRRGDIDWRNQRAVISGKGSKIGVIRFSNRSIAALKEYLAARGDVDPTSRMPLASQPLFARHDMSASKKVKAVKSGGMRKSIKSRMGEAGIDKSLIRIHDFRHYFVTVVYQETGDILAAKEGARHNSIATTGRYTHLLGSFDETYDKIFNRVKR